MNYYSRNSPIKRRHEQIPGFLLSLSPSRQSRATRPTSRSRISRSFHTYNSQSRQSSSVNSHELKYSDSMLILEDYQDPILSNQILIVDQQSQQKQQQVNDMLIKDEQNQQTQQQVNEILIIDQQSQQKQQQVNEMLIVDQQSQQKQQQVNEILIVDQQSQQTQPEQQPNSHASMTDMILELQGEESEQQRDKKVNELTENAGKAISLPSDNDNQSAKYQKIQIQENSDNRSFTRIFSFGSRNEVWPSGQDNSSDGPAGSQCRLLTAGSHETTKNFNSLQACEQSVPVKSDQHSFMEQFMSERSRNWQSQKGTEVNSEKEESQTGQVFSENHRTRREHSSEESGYFNDGSEPNHDQQHSTDQQNNDSDQHPNGSLTHQQPSSPKVHYFKDKTMKQHIPPVLENPPIAGYKQTLHKLCQTISSLPPKLMQPYLKLLNQLIHRQHTALVIQQKQQQTLNMLHLLILMHNKRIHIDDYALWQHSSRKQQQIEANQEIIYSLVRKLAHDGV